MTTDEQIAKIQLAIEAEITAVYRNQSRKFDLDNGHLVAVSDEGFLYSFRTELSINIPPESPVSFYPSDGIRCNGIWVSQNDFDVLINLEKSYGDTISRAKVSADLTYILRTLGERLKEQVKTPLLSSIVSNQLASFTFDEAGLTESMQKLDALGLKRNKSQEEAIRNCLSSAGHFVWGPPGTGKTANLAQACRVLQEQGQTSLVISHANAAVDVAALKIADAFANTKQLNNGEILRLGLSQSKEVRKREEISALGALKKHYPDLILRLNQLEQERLEIVRDIKGSSKKAALHAALKELRAELATIRMQIKLAETNLIKSAKVIIATASKFVIDERIWDLKPDNLIIDEASMLSYPFVFAAAGQTMKRLLFFGDFRQLPPVCISDESVALDWLSRDAFDIFGIQKNIDNGNEDSRVTMLNIQYRMPQAVGDIVSSFCYGGKLATDLITAEAAKQQARFSPAEGEPLVILDTSKCNTACFTEKKLGSYSRINPLHALFSLSLAQGLLADGAQDVAIITPYNAQARLIQALIKDCSMDRQVTVATIHRFQGAEMEVVIFDLVDALPQHKASKLTGSDAELSRRLLNVAISRTKGKLIVLADRDFINTYHNGRSSGRKLMQLMSKRPTVALSFEQLNKSDFEWHENWSASQARLYSLLEDSETKLLNLPGGFNPNNQLARLLQDESSKPAEPPQKPFLVDRFFYANTDSALALGGRDENSPIVMIDGPAKNHVYRAIIGH